MSRVPRARGPWRVQGSALALLTLSPALAHAADVAIAVHNVRDSRGQVLVAVCPKDVFLTPRCPYTAHANAAAGTVTVTVHGVPPGIYAAMGFQDVHEDGKLRRTLLGVPEEGVGFSRDAPYRFSPPGFGASAFAVGPAGAETEMTLRYFD